MSSILKKGIDMTKSKKYGDYKIIKKKIKKAEKRKKAMKKFLKYYKKIIIKRQKVKFLS